mgnify:CR=1 FL=1|jgi:pyridoxamine 5'-phosphate oxidase
MAKIKTNSIVRRNLMKLSVCDVNREYGLFELNEEDLDSDPFKQFEKWFNEALEANLILPNAMALATATKEGRPSVRMMLLKGFDERGFLFYSNCKSRKGIELAENPYAAVVFWWAELERQVRIEGSVSVVPDEEADAYFATRPRGSQIGAWVSNQSQVISGREEINHRFNELEIKYKDQDIPRPPYWVGYCLSPVSFEFWQGRPNRLHDRLRYRLLDNGNWVIERLAP